MGFCDRFSGACGGPAHPVAPGLAQSQHAIDLLLIALGALYFGGNATRIALLALWGPLEGPVPALWSILTFLTLLGWVAFSALLLWRAARNVLSVPLWLSLWLYVPPALYAGALLSASVLGGWPGGLRYTPLQEPSCYT